MGRYDFRNQDYKITRIFRGNGGDIVDRAHTGGAVLTRVFSPATVGEFRFGYAYRRVDLPTEEGFENFPTDLDHRLRHTRLAVGAVPDLPEAVRRAGGRVGRALQGPPFFEGRVRSASDLQQRHPERQRARDGHRSASDTAAAASRTFWPERPPSTRSRSAIRNATSACGIFGALRAGRHPPAAQPDAQPRAAVRIADRVEGEDGLTHVRLRRRLVQTRATRRRRVGRQRQRRLGRSWRLRLSYDRVNFFFLRSLQFQEPQIRTITLLPTTDPLRVEALGTQRRTGAVSGPLRRAKSIPIFSWAASIPGTRPSSVASVQRVLCARVVRRHGVARRSSAARPEPRRAHAPTRHSRTARRAALSLSSATSPAWRMPLKAITRAASRASSAGSPSGLQFQVSYTLSEALDMASDPGFGSGDNYISMNHAGRSPRSSSIARAVMELRKADLYGPSRFDMRHVLIVSGSYGCRGAAPGVVGALVSDWSLSASACRPATACRSASLCSANSGDCNFDGFGQDRANIADPSVLGTQIDGYPRVPTDTARIYIPIARVRSDDCTQAGATGNCVYVGGGSAQPRNSFRYDDSFSVDFGRRAIDSNGRPSARPSAFRALQSVQHSVRARRPCRLQSLKVWTRLRHHGNRSWQLATPTGVGCLFPDAAAAARPQRVEILQRPPQGRQRPGDPVVGAAHPSRCPAGCVCGGHGSARRRGGAIRESCRRHSRSPARCSCCFKCCRRSSRR